MTEKPAPDIPPGTIAIISADETARYHLFTLSMANLVMPQGSRMVWTKGPSVVDNLNGAVAEMKGDWLWVIGDDHCWDDQYLLLKLLDDLYVNDLDVVVPVCLMRGFPLRPVLYGERGEEGYVPLDLDAVRGQTLIEVEAAGNAGMLIRYRVLAALGDPVWKYGDIFHPENPAALAEDLLFCSEAKAAGFKLHADLNLRIGHITPVVIWPAYNQEESGAKVAFGEETVFLPRSVLG